MPNSTIEPVQIVCPRGINFADVTESSRGQFDHVIRRKLGALGERDLAKAKEALTEEYRQWFAAELMKRHAEVVEWRWRPEMVTAQKPDGTIRLSIYSRFAARSN
jgi:hypothetical protein